MLGDMSICFAAQQLVKIASKHITWLHFDHVEDFIVFQNILGAQKIAIEKIIKEILYGVYDVLHVITGCIQCCFVVLCNLQLLCAHLFPFTQSEFHDLVCLTQTLFNVSKSQSTQGTLER